MAINQDELEQLPPQGHVKVVYLGPVAPHWDVHGVFGDGRVVDEFRQRALRASSCCRRTTRSSGATGSA